MTIASVTFMGKPEQVGGAQIPALAFKKWCDIFEISCDYLVWDQTTPEKLNEYEAIFFCTVPTEEQVYHIEVPYVVMIHAEFDIPTKAIDRAKALVVIGENYWGYGGKEILWYPCVFPEYLCTGDEKWYEDKKGMLYSARLTTWKNATLLAGLTRYKDFQKRWGPVYVAGKANHDHYQESIDLIDPDWTVISGLFDIHHYGKTRAKHNQRSTYWEVFGTPKNRIQIPRVNLSGAEAMHFGLVPVIDKRSAPVHMHEYSIDISQLSDCNNVEEKRKQMHYYLPRGPYGYTNVYGQVSNIIEVLLDGKS